MFLLECVSGESTTIVLLEDPNGSDGTPYVAYDWDDDWSYYWMGDSDCETEMIWQVHKQLL